MTRDRQYGEKLLYHVLEEHGIPRRLILESCRVLDSLKLLDQIQEVTPLTQSMTNHIFVFVSGERKLLLRLPGEGTEYLVDRAHEVSVYQALDGQGITETVLYINAENGIKVSQFISDVHPCDPQNKEDIKKCLGVLKKFHDKKLSVPHSFRIFEQIQKYEKQCDMEKIVFPDFSQVRKQVMSLRILMQGMEDCSCLCHIDSICANFLVGDGGTYLVDWEYASMSNPYIDVAMFCIYTEYDKEMTDWVIREYLKEDDSPETRMYIYGYMSAAAFLWVLWCEIKRAGGVDFHDYEVGQYRLAKEFYQYAMEIYHEGHGGYETRSCWGLT